MTARYDAEDVRAALTPEAVLSRYGWRHHRAGRRLRAVECPACGGGSSDAFVVADRGFVCFRCERKGDLLALVALFEGLDTRRDFERVIEVAAGIAGVPPRDHELTAEERAQRRWFRDRQRREQERQRAAEERQRFEAAAAKASAIWDALKRRNRPGEEYLRERGLEDLIGRDDLVRFDERGTVRIPLHDGEGRIVNVPGRYLPGREPKPGRRILNVTGCPTRGSFGHPDDLLHFAGPVVVTEGIFDYLSACSIWPDRAVFGAHGASNLRHVARMVAERIRDSDRIVYFVPHPDPAGARAFKAAVKAATEVGLPSSRQKVYDTSAAGDLNDWLRADVEGQPGQSGQPGVRQ